MKKYVALYQTRGNANSTACIRLVFHNTPERTGGRGTNVRGSYVWDAYNGWMTTKIANAIADILEGTTDWEDIGIRYFYPSTNKVDTSRLDAVMEANQENN